MKLSLSSQVLVFSQLQSPSNLLNKLYNKLTTFLDQLGNAYMINIIKKTINDWTHLPPVPVVICYHETWVWDAVTKFWILPELFQKNRPVIRVNLNVKGGPPAHGRVALVVVPLLLHGDQEAG